MSVNFYSAEQEDCNRNLQSLIRHNNGFFKSEKQAAFITSGKLVKPWNWSLKLEQIPEADICRMAQAKFKVPLEANQDLLLIEGCVTWANYGRSTRRVGWIFVIDQNGVVGSYKLHYTYADGVTNVNPTATETLWKRTSKELPNFRSAKEVEAEKIEERKIANAHLAYIGNIKERLVFEGTIKSCISDGFKTYGYSNTCEAFITEIVTDDGNIIKYFGKLQGTSQGDRIKFRATIIGHNEYKEVKQTVVNRPHLL